MPVNISSYKLTAKHELRTHFHVDKSNWNVITLRSKVAFRTNKNGKSKLSSEYLDFFRRHKTQWLFNSYRINCDESQCDFFIRDTKIAVLFKLTYYG